MHRNYTHTHTHARATKQNNLKIMWIKSEKHLCGHLPIMVTYLPTICSAIAFREAARQKPMIWDIALKRYMVHAFY